MPSRDVEEAIVALAVAFAYGEMEKTAEKANDIALMDHMGITHQKITRDLLYSVIGGLCEVYKIDHGTEGGEQTALAVVTAFRMGYAMCQGMDHAREEAAKIETRTKARSGAPRVRPRRGR